MSEIEIRSLNGHKLVDETARQMIVNLPKGEPDWNAKEGEEGYIKNRTHWDERGYTEFTMEISPAWGEEEYDINFTELKWGETYPIIWNGVTYECQAYYVTDYDENTHLSGKPWLNLGNLRLLLDDEVQHLYPENDVPFIFTVREYEGRMKVRIYTVENREGNFVTATFTVPTGQVYKINNDYLPEGAQIGKKGTAQASEIFGNTDLNQATNYAAHAEGSGTIASGRESHAEGRDTEAKGEHSHVEGTRTKASSYCQHVQGKHNIEDSNDTYLHIVGNGTSADPSNAHTLDWDGNAWYSGDIYVGSTSGTNKDEGSKKLATEEYVAEEIANIGNTLALHPIGSIYMSVNETSPAELFGGTWEQLKNRFLLGTSDAHPLGEEGGSETHKLTTSELPTINGTISLGSGQSGASAQGYGGVRTASGVFSGTIKMQYGKPTPETSKEYVSGTTSYRDVKMNFGGGQAHNNMPPYIAVNIWKRVA